MNLRMEGNGNAVFETQVILFSFFGGWWDSIHHFINYLTKLILVLSHFISFYFVMKKETLFYSMM